MRIAVVGAGIAGTTTAHELALDGHEVVVFERRSTVAEVASFATGPLVAPGWTADWLGDQRRLRMPWAAQGAGMRLPRLPPASEWPWLWQWSQAGRTERQTPAQQLVHRAVRYSQQRRQDIGAEYELDHDRSEGMLVLWRDAREADLAQAALNSLREADVAFKVLSAEQARALEPALHPETTLHGAVELQGEAVANCREFALLIRSESQRLGARFEFDTLVRSIAPQVDGRVELTLTPAGPEAESRNERFDAVVLCAGALCPPLLRPLGLRLPLRTVHAHTLSAAVREPLDAPLSAVLDARSGVSISRLGQRVRVAGGHYFGEPPAVPSKQALTLLYKVLADWFPGAMRLGGPKGSIQEWQAVRAAMPDGLPLLGATRQAGVWLNLGHETAGWAMACGNARVLADRLRGREPDIDLGGFAPQRLGL